MDEKLQITLESRIQELLAGELGQTETAELLVVIGRDDEARRILAEVLELQRQSRRSFGYDVGNEVIQASLAKTTGSLHEMSIPAPVTARRSRPNLRKLMMRIAWPIRIAAMVVIGVSVFMAVTARHDSRLLLNQLARTEQVVTLPKPTVEELMCLRRVWNQVSESSGNFRPWVFLSNGTGQFAYVPADSVATNGSKLVLLRCVIVSGERQSTMQMNLLLPAQQAVQLTVPEAGLLAGQPIRLAVSASKEWASIGLNVGSDSDGSAGVQGRVRIGGGATEIGQFRLDGKKMKVILQATTLNGDVI